MLLAPGGAACSPGPAASPPHRRLRRSAAAEPGAPSRSARLAPRPFTGEGSRSLPVPAPAHAAFGPRNEAIAIPGARECAAGRSQQGGRELTQGRDRSEDAAGPCLARTRCERYERGFKTGAANAPFSPASPTTAGDATSVPSASWWSAGGRGAGAGRPRGQVSTREWAAWSQRESRSSRAFCLPEPALPDEPGAGCTCGLLPIRPPGLKICDARKLTKFSTGHFTPHENPPHYQRRIPPWVTRAVSARRCRPGLG